MSLAEKFETIEEQKQDLIKRYELENERYWNLYHVRKEDLSNSGWNKHSEYLYAVDVFETETSRARYSV